MRRTEGEEIAELVRTGDRITAAAALYCHVLRRVDDVILAARSLHFRAVRAVRYLVDARHIQVSAVLRELVAARADQRNSARVARALQTHNRVASDRPHRRYVARRATQRVIQSEVGYNIIAVRRREQERLRKRTSFNRIVAAAALDRHIFARVGDVVALARARNLRAVECIVDVRHAVHRDVTAALDQLQLCRIFQCNDALVLRALQRNEHIVARLRRCRDRTRRAFERIAFAEVEDHVVARVGSHQIHIAVRVRTVDRIIARPGLDRHVLARRHNVIIAAAARHFPRIRSVENVIDIRHIQFPAALREVQARRADQPHSALVARTLQAHNHIVFVRNQIRDFACRAIQRVILAEVGNYVVAVRRAE